MKAHQFFLLLLVAAGAPLVGCTTTQTDDSGRPEGIEASETGMTRESVYEWQDQTFRELAY